MILFAMIVRSLDGLPLSATTDVNGQVYKDIKEVRMQMKMVSRQISRLDDRCTIKLNPHLIHIIRSIGVSFMALCESSYPPVLAFSFLDELQREFITTYDVHELNNVTRPYAFIEFDSFIQKTRQRYNSPRSLTTRIDLSNLSTEIKLRPPQQLNLGSLLPQNRSNQSISPLKGGSKHFSSLPWYGIITIIISIPCILLCAYRGISGLTESSIEEIDGSNPLHGIVFLLEALLGCLQVYLLLYKIRKRILYSWISFMLIVICNFYLWDLTDYLQILIYVGIAALRTGSIKLQQYEPKMPNYNV